MSVSVTFTGTIIEDEGDKLAVEAGAEDNNVTGLPSSIATELMTAESADHVTPPSASSFFPTFAQANNIVSITGATGTTIALFSDANGVPLSGTDSGLTTDDGTKIYLYTSPSNHQIVYGIAQSSPGNISSGSLVFAIVLQDTFDGSGNLNGGNFFIEQYQAIKNPLTNQVDDNDIVNLAGGTLFVSASQNLVFSDFSKVPSGNDLWAGIQPTGSTNPNAPDLLVTGGTPNATDPSHGDEVNVSSTGLAVNNQTVDPGETMRIDFVNNVLEPETPGTDSSAAALHYDSRQNGTGGGWSPVQTTPTNSLVSARMVAYEVTGTQTMGDYFTQITNNNPGGTPDGTQTQAVIHDVNVVDASGHPVGTAVNNHTATANAPEVHTLTSGQNGVTVSFDINGAAIVSNIAKNYLVTFDTETVMDRFTIANVGKKNFDVGNIQALGVSFSSADASLRVNFEDAGPTITASAAGEPTLTTTDPNSGSSSTANGAFAGQFTSSFGADGAASSGATAYALSTSGGASGLTDTATGQSVVLSLDTTTGNIVGKTATSGDTVFTVSVDSTGKVTLTQLRAVVQPTASSPDTGETVGLSGANLVVLRKTITDGDGDSAAASLDLTPTLLFKDVGPTITASATGEPTLTTTDPTSGNTSTAPGAFGVQFTVNFNADGPAQANSETFAFSNVSGVDSGLVDTATGQHVLLSGGGSQITGTVNSGATTVFTVAVDGSGNVTLTQDRAVVQPNGTNPDTGETVGLSGTNKVVLNATVTDGDGDQAAASLDLTPTLLFKDVGPSIVVNSNTPPTLPTTDPLAPAISSANGDFSVDFTPTYNADGPGATPLSYALSLGSTSSGLTDSLSGQSVVLSVNADGSLVTGKTQTSGLTVFTVGVDGTGKVTLTQDRAVVQPIGSNPDTGETVGLSGTNIVVLKATATDGDGDQATASLDLTPQISFKDVGPDITVANITNGTYAGTPSGSSTWSEAPNADGFKSLNVTLNNYTIDNNPTVTVNSSLGTDTTTDANGNYVFNGTINADFNGDGTPDMVAFKMTFDPVGDTYKIDVTTPPTTVMTFDTSQGSLAAGGPDPVQTLTFSSGPSAGKSVVFFGVKPLAPTSGVAGGDALATPPQTPNDIEDLVYPGVTDLTKSQIDAYLTPTDRISTLIDSSTQMNVSTSGIGINNNNFDGSGTGIGSTDESFVVNPQLPVDKVTVFIDNSVGGYNPNTEDLEYRTYFIDGTNSGTPKKVGAADLHPVTTGPAAGGNSFDISDVAGGPQIDAVQLIMANGTVKIPVIQFSIQQTFAPQPLNMNLTATLTDGDNDTKQSPFSIALA